MEVKTIKKTITKTHKEKVYFTCTFSISLEHKEQKILRHYTSITGKKNKVTTTTKNLETYWLRRHCHLVLPQPRKYLLAHMLQTKRFQISTLAILLRLHKIF